YGDARGKTGVTPEEKPGRLPRKNRGDSLFSLLENRELYRFFRPTGWDLIIGSCPPFFKDQVKVEK
ncbi:MAG: hypothetical protein Q8O17_00275, partial [Candidatus Methanoperedens sp.]|nr:hypothetical protein [Candidatus Methanoperedens sp.]